MARETKCRRVESIPRVTEFKPVGIPRSRLKETILKVEELEAIRLKDLMSLEQEECAERMGVSRPTFQRILSEGRRKIAGALIQGEAIRVEGGDYCLGQGHCRKANRFRINEDCPFRDILLENEKSTAKAGTKIAICASDASSSAVVDGLFGHCAFFIIWDDEQKCFQAINNQGSHLNHLAGNEAAQELLHHDAGILLCNRIGPNAFALLKKAGVKIYLAEEGLPWEMVLKLYQEGLLPLIEAANNV